MWRDLFNFDTLYTAFAFRAYWLFCVKRELFCVKRELFCVKRQLFYVEKERQQIFVRSVTCAILIRGTTHLFKKSDATNSSQMHPLV